MTALLHELASLTADLRAWLEWESELGAYALPRDTAPVRQADVEPPAAVPPPSRAPSPSTSEAQGRPGRWAGFAAGGDLVVSAGPKTAAVCIIRTAGSSPEAEAMFDKMVENVLGIPRAEVAVLDLARVRREPTAFATALRPHLDRIQPSLIVVMGTLGARALLGADADVNTCRGQWHAWPLPSGDVPTRITHHPEAIRLKRESGDAGPAREAFQDLQAAASKV